MMKLFLSFEIAKITRFFKTRTLAKIIISSMFLGIFAFVGIGLYYFFLPGFKFIIAGVEADIQAPLSLFLYELFLVILSGVIAFSVAVSGIFSLFRGSNDSWVMSSPRFRIFPRVVFVKSIMTSSWPLFVMFLPAILALNTIYHIGFVGMMFMLVSAILMLIIINGLVLLFILLLCIMYYRLSQMSLLFYFTFGRFVTLIVLVTAGLIAVVWNSVRSVDIVRIFKADNADAVLGLSDIGKHFQLLPTHPFALEIVNWQVGQSQAALFQTALLAVLAIVLSTIWWKVSYLFYPMWQKFQEGSTQSAQSPTSLRTRKMYLFTGSNTTALFKKEALVSSRNLKGLLWFSFLFIIWLAQVAISIVSQNTIRINATDITERIAILETIQFIIAVYFICAFTLRFVFPSFSVEKKTAWILSSAPLNFKKIFFSKYVFFTTLFVSVGVLMSTVNALALSVAGAFSLYASILFIVTVVFIVTFGLSLGALFPSLDTDDPEVISTSMSGLFFTALSLLYGALSAGVLYLAITKGSFSLSILFTVFTACVVTVLLYKVPSIVKNIAQ